MSAFADAGLLQISRSSAPSVRSVWFELAVGGRFFDGHFEGAPILPGVAHLALALAALGNGERALTGARGVRFKRPLAPGDEVEVVLDESSAGSAVRFEIRCRGEVATSGLLLFESDADASRP